MHELFSEKERDYQNKVVSWFSDKQGLNYEYLGYLQYAKGADCLEDGTKNSPIREADLAAFLRKKNYTERQVADVLAQVKKKIRLSNKKMASLLDVNSAFYHSMVYGIKSKPTDEANEQDVMLFDFNNVYENHFAIAEEVSYKDILTSSGSRPDLVVYVNGIALAVIELKSCIVSLDEGIMQTLSNEQDLIPSFFTTAQITVASSQNNGFKYGTIGTSLKFWCPFKPDTNDVGIKMTDEESYKAFFQKETFMRFFRYGITNDHGKKKIMRPHQYHALVAAIPRLEKKESGIIWHSQGSGKSLTMVWLANYIKANFSNPRVVIITDRTELDKQIYGNFINTGNSIHRAKSKDDLLDKLNTGTECVISTLIHKFGDNAENDTEKNNIAIPLDKYLADLQSIIAAKYPNGFSVKGDNIFVFIDECHRTQGGFFHEAMREIMGKEVMLIGFTGTPLLKNDKINNIAHQLAHTSEYRIGSFIHKYLHKQAVEDGVIKDLQYEARDVEQVLTQKEMIDARFAQLVKDGNLDKDQEELLKQRWGTLEKVYSSEDRIKRIGYSILDDMSYNPTLQQDWCNAMLIAGNIYSAYKYYEFFSKSELKDKVAVVTSYNPTDYNLRKQTTDTAKEGEAKFKYNMALQSFKDAEQKDAESYETWAKYKFIHQPAQLKLMIVVDKLLTGFDAPCATFLYIDKTIVDHTLFQAICRVNRLGEDIKDENGNIIAKTHKEFGQIVDFKHLFSSISDAVTKFNDENGGFGNFDPEDIEDLLKDSISANKKRLEVALKEYRNQRSSWEKMGILHDQEKLIEYFMSDEDQITAAEKRELMYVVNSHLISSYSNISDYMGKAGYSQEETDAICKLVSEAARITARVKLASGDGFDPRQFDPDMRKLLDRFIRAEDAQTIIPADTDFSFLDVIDVDSDTDDIVKKAFDTAGGRKKAAAERIEAQARVVINNAKKKDPELGKLFSEQLAELLENLKKASADFETKAKQLIELLKKVKGGGVSYPQGIMTPRSKALWNNRENWCNESDESHIVDLIAGIDNLVEYDAGRDYRDIHHSDAQYLLDEMKERYPGLSEEQRFNIYSLVVNN